jgi:transcriptional regulator with XRE-family HTH domain
MSRVPEAELARRARIFKAAMEARDPHWGPVEIAERAGLKDHSQVSRIVRGEVPGSWSRVRAIAHVLSIPLSVLLDDASDTSEDSEPDTSPLVEGRTPASAGGTA